MLNARKDWGKSKNVCNLAWVKKGENAGYQSLAQDCLAKTVAFCIISVIIEDIYFKHGQAVHH